MPSSVPPHYSIIFETGHGCKGNNQRLAWYNSASTFVHVVPYIPRLEEHRARGRYISETDAEAIGSRLPAYAQNVFGFAIEYGTRKGQLARTLRRFVDLERAVIEWPPAECKHKEAHTVPLEGRGLAIVKERMARPPMHCPYLFHGPHCRPGQAVSKTYGCIGDFKKAWKAACKKAGLPPGRKVGGFVFHHTRNTAATNLRAGGMEEADAMLVTGHTTTHVFKHYNLGNVEALRARLSKARATSRKVASLRSRASRGDNASQRVAG
jgi:integrase